MENVRRSGSRLRHEDVPIRRITGAGELLRFAFSECSDLDVDPFQSSQTQESGAFPILVVDRAVTGDQWGP